MQAIIDRYFNVLGNLPLATRVTGKDGKQTTLAQAFSVIAPRMRIAHDQGNKLMFVGNGGSAGICSHMAIDYSKNGGMRSLAFNDPSALTCLGNDLGFENVFAKQIDLHGVEGDILIAISSSGKSANILKAVEAARERGCFVVTLSGFDAANPLRKFGDYNLFVDSQEYGFVEVTHLALCHAILDIEMGWGREGESTEEKKLGLRAKTLVA